MVCAHCGAQMAASQRICHQCGHSASAVSEAATAIGLTELTTAADTPTPLPARSTGEDLTIAPVSHREPDTHARPAIVSGDPPTGRMPGAAPPGEGSATATFQTGTRFGRRYHLIRQLGVGGMGAVYQAWDDELAVVVAIKVIRPEAMADPVVARDLSAGSRHDHALDRSPSDPRLPRLFT